MNNELSIQSRTNIVLWLFSGCFLIFVMVVVGGITRLTGSGLSITKWDVVTGTIPPVSEADWQKEFNHYKETPQFQKINTHFELADFKQIYWWEYIHRLIGRVIGLVFVVPFIWFIATKQLSRALIIKSLILFFLGGLQGFIGWYMVKSGLVDIPNVSHFRLALHLSTAFLTFGLTFWFALELINTKKNKLAGWQIKFYNIIRFAFLLTILQIIYGAFVAGMKAGYIYNTWPMMGERWIAESVSYSFEKMGVRALIDNMSAVQFVHRTIALILAAIILFMAWFALRMNKKQTLKLTSGQVNALALVFVVLIIQFTLGVFTLLYAVPIVLGVLHQAGAFFLFSSLLYLMHRMKYVPVSESQA